MLTMEKVIEIQRLLDVLIYMFENKVSANKIKISGTSLESRHGRYIIKNKCCDSWYIVLRSIEEDWFITSIHPESEVGYSRQWNANANHTPLGQMVCTYCSNAPSAFNIPDLGLVFETIRSTNVTESELFQLQTLHEDKYTLALVLEVYLRDKIKDYYYVPVNIDKLLSMEVYHIEEITSFWQNYIEVYEEIGYD